MNGKWGYVDKTGKMIIEAQFDRALTFSDGRAAMRVGLLNWGFIDRTGQFVVKPEYDDASPFSEGLAHVKKKNKHGYIDTTGQMVIPLQFSLADSFVDGVARVFFGFGHWGYIDKTGKSIWQNKKP